MAKKKKVIGVSNWGQSLFFGLPTLLSVCSNPNFFTVLDNQ